MGLLDVLMNMSTIACILFIIGFLLIIAEMFQPGFGWTGGMGIVVLYWYRRKKYILSLTGEKRMKKYEYVEVNIARFVGAKSEEHRQIIDAYAAKGYRYVGFIPTSISDYGKFKKLHLIFEKESEL